MDLRNDDSSGGLVFNSHDHSLDDRTGFNVTPDRPLNLGNDFRLEFDLVLFREPLAYGYVFRLYSSGEQTLDMVVNSNTNSMNFVLLDRHDLVANVDFSGRVDISNESWHHVALGVSLSGIVIQVDGESVTMERSFDDFKNLNLVFGKNDDPFYYTADVPPMVVKNLSLIRGDEVRYHWELVRHCQTAVYDEIQGARADVTNGIWGVNRHTSWRNMASLQIRDEDPKFTFDVSSGNLILALKDSVYVADLSQWKPAFSRSAVSSGHPLLNSGNQIYFDDDRACLSCYSLYGLDMVTYDGDDASWSDETVEVWPPLHQHCHSYSPHTKRLVTFGGYGNHTYHSSYRVIDLADGTSLAGDLSETIYPRYLAAMGQFDDDHYFIMGGIGNKSGRQMDSTYPFYDIYELDATDGSVKKIADIESSPAPLVFGNSAVFDRRDSLIYALSFNNIKFNTDLHLTCYDLKNGKMSEFAAPVPYHFLDYESQAELYINRDSTCMYAVVMDAKVSGATSINIYELSYPPMYPEDVTQSVPLKVPVWLIIVAFLLVVLLVLQVLYVRKKRAKKINPDDLFMPARTREFYNISLLGGLQIFDSEKQDITSNIQPTPRNIFLLCLLASATDGKGMTSQHIDETFWLGMDRGQASNNRNVNIRKLRIQLKRVGNISLEYNNDYWTLVFGEGVECDYIKLTRLLDRADFKHNADEVLLDRILEVASRGTLLPNTNFEWLDDYKDKAQEKLLGVLGEAAANPSIAANARLMYRIADIYQMYDPIEEEALRIKCSVLSSLGRKGLSKQLYDDFCKEYLRLLGESYPLAYEDVAGHDGVNPSDDGRSSSK